MATHVAPAAARKAVTAGAIGNIIEWYDLAALVEMFPANVRYSALGVNYNIAVAAFGGRPPLSRRS